jgi:hypothetical protein
MMALLSETIPASEATWIECLGDLARYRLAIDDRGPVVLQLCWVPRELPTAGHSMVRCVATIQFHRHIGCIASFVYDVC